jgi:hypothetical protein
MLKSGALAGSVTLGSMAIPTTGVQQRCDRAAHVLQLAERWQQPLSDSALVGAMPTCCDASCEL